MNQEKKHITIDPVLDSFNDEKQFSAKQDFHMNLEGIPIQFLNGIEDNETAIALLETLKEKLGIEYELWNTPLMQSKINLTKLV